jgi:cytochrome c
MTRAFLIGAIAAAMVLGPAAAQIPLPTAPAVPAAPDPAQVFTSQCGVCHSVAAGAPHRQGPNLHGVFGRQAGQAENFRYSPALAGAQFTWDEARLDAYLTNPQAAVAGSNMLYRQANPATRAAIITFLKEQR